MSDVFSWTMVQVDQTAFRFLRQASKPNAPRPVAKSGRAAGSGTCDGVPSGVPTSATSPEDTPTVVVPWAATNASRVAKAGVAARSDVVVKSIAKVEPRAKGL